MYSFVIIDITNYIIFTNFQHDKEKRDNRGRTPLMLAVTLGHLESARTLLNAEANVNCENLNGWTGKLP